MHTRPGSNAFGRLTSPAGRTLIVEAVHDTSRGYGFTDTETGRSLSIPADGTWTWQFVPRDRLRALTGLDVAPAASAASSGAAPGRPSSPATR
jgi:hypothetical protein